MKKLIKGFIITAALMIVIGIGLFIGGIMAAGGVAAAQIALNDSGVSQRTGHILDFDLDLDNQPYINSETSIVNDKHYSDMEEQTFSVDNVKSLRMELDTAQVEIIENDSSSEFLVRTDGNYEVYVKNGVLRIKTKRKLNDTKMLLEVPEDFVFESVEIFADACALDIRCIEAKEFDVEVGAGQMTIGELVSNSAEFEIGAGEIIVDYANVSECDVNVGMGNFEYNGEILRHGNIECGMGNAELYLEGSAEDYNYEIDCAAGDVTIGEESFAGLGAGRNINNHADATMDIECSMGNVTVGF